MTYCHLAKVRGDINPIENGVININVARYLRKITALTDNN